MTQITGSKSGIEPIFISVAEAADALAVSRWQMYQLLNEQRIESRYQGRKRLVLVDSLRTYANNLPADADGAA